MLPLKRVLSLQVGLPVVLDLPVGRSLLCLVRCLSLSIDVGHRGLSDVRCNSR